MTNNNDYIHCANCLVTDRDSKMFHVLSSVLNISTFISLGILLILSFGFIYIRNVYSYWQRRSVCTAVPPTFPIGSFGKILLQKCTIGELMQEFYNSSTEPLIGVYAGIRAMLIPRDTQLIRNILNSDFQHFHDRGMYWNEKDDPLTAQLLMTPGEKWKHMRAKLTPTFTSGKLKAMFSTLIDCARPLQEHLEPFAGRPESVEVRDICSRFTMTIICSCAFGIEIDCIANPDEEFLRQGRKFFELSLNNVMRQLLSFVSPALMKALRMRLFDREMAEFMIAMVKQNLEYREGQNVIRKDFFQLLVQIRNGGNVERDGEWATKITGEEKDKTLSIEEVAAHAYLFLIAGYESSSSTMSFLLYELARNVEAQGKVHAEIDQVLAKYDGQVTYESLREMKYLDCCIDGKSWSPFYVQLLFINNSHCHSHF